MRAVLFALIPSLIASFTPLSFQSVQQVSPFALHSVAPTEKDVNAASKGVPISFIRPLTDLSSLTLPPKPTTAGLNAEDLAKYTAKSLKEAAKVSQSEVLQKAPPACRHSNLR